MSQAPMTPDDPRLTAYVLGELSPAESAEVEQALARSPELRRAADELRETTAELFAALQQEPVPAAELNLPQPQRSPAVSTPVAAPVAAIVHPSARRSPREALLLVNALTLLILLGVVVAFQTDSPPQGAPAPLALHEESRLQSTAADGLLRLAERPADVRNQWQETVDRYNLLMEQNRLGEAQALARDSLEAAPRDPVARQMYRQSHFGAWSRGTQPDSQQLPEALQDADSGAIRPSPVAESAPAKGGSPVPAEQRFERDDRSISVPQLPALTELEKLRQVPEASGSGRGEERLERPLILLAEPLPTTANKSRQQLSHPGSAPVPTTPLEAAGRMAGAGGALPRDGEAAVGQREQSPAPILNKSPYVAGNAVLRRKYLADETASDGAAFGRNRHLSELRTRAERELSPESAPTDNYYAGHRFQFVEEWSWRDQDTVLPFPAYAPSGTESYAPIVENDFILPRGEAALSTFALDVDTASYSNVRRFLTHNQLPPPDAVRLEELVNYFRYDLPQPEGEEPFSVTLEAASCPWNPVHRLVRIGLQGREIDLTQRPRTRLVFLLDVSGSMAPANRLPLVKESMKLLVKQLGENDRIAIVTYAGEAELKLDSTPGDQRETILAAIESLRAGGSTNGAGGIQLAYQVAARHFDKEASNRIILCTDGDFNVGVSSDDELVRMIEEKRKSGVFLSIFGFGYGNLKDSKLEGLANKGNGHYAYIDDLDEARKVFIEELTGMLYTIAKDVKLQVEFNPARVASYRLLGYENRLLQAEDFNNDQVDAGEMGAGHSVTALYEVIPTGAVAAVEARVEPTVDPLRYQSANEPGTTSGSRASDPASSTESPPSPASGSNADRPPLDPPPSTDLLTVKLRYKQPDGETSVKREFPLPDEPRASSKDLQFAAAVTGFGLLLRNSQHASGCNWDLVIELAEGGKGDDPTGRRGEFVDLARHARRLWQASNRGLPPSGRIPQMTSATPEPITAAIAAQPAILQIDQTTQHVQINRGALDDVRPGMTFYVLEQPPAGAGGQQPQRKGKLEVVSVNERFAQGRILDEDRSRPIAAGDPVESPEWPPQIVAVSGSRFAVVSLGAKHGNRDGELFEVVRFAPEPDAAGQRRPRFLGELRIIDVQHDVSVGQFAPATADDAIAVGDRVTPRR